MHKALYRLTINVWLELDRPRGEKVEQFDEVGILGYASHSPARTKEDLKRIKHDFLLQHTKILPAHSLQHWCERSYFLDIDTAGEDKAGDPVLQSAGDVTQL
jgi:hypothetical protein